MPKFLVFPPHYYVWSRVLWAGHTSMSVTAIVLSLTALLGTSMGLFSGYWGGVVDELSMR